MESIGLNRKGSNLLEFLKFIFGRECFALWSYDRDRLLVSKVIEFNFIIITIIIPFNKRSIRSNIDNPFYLHPKLNIIKTPFSVLINLSYKKVISFVPMNVLYSLKGLLLLLIVAPGKWSNSLNVMFWRYY